MNVEFACPTCGHPNFSHVDPIPGVHRWTTDCENCCNPIALKVRIRDGEIEEVEVEREQD